MISFEQISLFSDVSVDEFEHVNTSWFIVLHNIVEVLQIDNNFLTIWLPYSQLWAIVEGAASLTEYWSLRFYIFVPRVTRILVTRLGP